MSDKKGKCAPTDDNQNLDDAQDIMIKSLDEKVLENMKAVAASKPKPPHAPLGNYFVYFDSEFNAIQTFVATGVQFDSGYPMRDNYNPEFWNETKGDCMNDAEMNADVAEAWRLATNGIANDNPSSWVGYPNGDYVPASIYVNQIYKNHDENDAEGHVWADDAALLRYGLQPVETIPVDTGIVIRETTPIETIGGVTIPDYK